MKLFGISLVCPLSSIEAFNITTSNCGKVWIDEIIRSHLQRCDYYDISHTDCVTWIEQELNTTCRAEYSCIETSPGDLSFRKSYSGISDT